MTCFQISSYDWNSRPQLQQNRVSSVLRLAMKCARCITLRSPIHHYDIDKLRSTHESRISISSVLVSHVLFSSILFTPNHNFVSPSQWLSQPTVWQKNPRMSDFDSSLSLCLHCGHFGWLNMISTAHNFVSRISQSSVPILPLSLLNLHSSTLL
jgi:hypothetical protein